MHLIKVHSNGIVTALHKNPYFEDLSREHRLAIARCTKLVAFERGETLFWEGDPSSGLHIVQEGSIKLYRVSPQGRQYIVRILMENDTFNEVSVFDKGNNPVNAETLEASRVWVVEAECARDLVKQDSAFAQKVINNPGLNLRTLVHAVSEMAFYQVTHRLARLIMQLPESGLAGHRGTRLTQDQLAARLGTVREVVARSLRELERSGAIRVADRRIAVSDEEILQEWAQGPWN
ncbi:MAG: Crp/Fnr family transcriptional regulator [Chloroflexota bacterium]